MPLIQSITPNTAAVGASFTLTINGSNLGAVKGIEFHIAAIQNGGMGGGDPGVRAWQDRLTPAWKRVGGGCHLNRKIDELIEAAGFQITTLTTCYLPGPRPMTYTYQGFAQIR